MLESLVEVRDPRVGDLLELDLVPVLVPPRLVRNSKRCEPRSAVFPATHTVGENAEDGCAVTENAGVGRAILFGPDGLSRSQTSEVVRRGSSCAVSARSLWCRW